MAKNHNKFANTFHKITSMDNLIEAYNRTQLSGSKENKSAVKFSLNLMHNLRNLQTELLDGDYRPGKYNIFKVHEPKERVIAAPKFKDKLVQFALHNVLNPGFENKFIYDSYSCINGKGTHKCAKRIRHFLAKANWRWDDPWIVKCDIKKYFYSIDHNILKEILDREIADKRTLKLACLIIDGSVDDVGLPLGNITSQLFANIYLNEMDKHIKRVLLIKEYARYMDDFCALVGSRSRAKKLKKQISNFVQDNLNLKLNKKKSKIFPLKQGVNMVGYKIFATHMLLRKRSKEKMKQKPKKFKELLKTNQITKNKVEDILCSWKGHAEHACSENFFKYLEDRFTYIYRNSKGHFKVDLKEANQ